LTVNQGNTSLFDLELSRAQHTHVFVVGPYLTERAARHMARNDGPAPSMRSHEERIEEAIGLARAIDLEVVGSEIAPLSEIRPASFIGKGKLESIAELVKERAIELVMLDCALSPVQQRNLEKAFGAKVIDRTGLILEIFGRRARTREGSLQVELAHLAYQRSRLVRSWTHLERQRGGFGFLGGPGETQIEADRRLIQERISRIEKDLEQVKRTRSLHRKKRADVPFPVVALVGYTNAGKSTLFNRLTRAEVLAKDMLFATLDPTLRAIKLPHGAPIMLSDTVGFISDLPDMLVTAFRATLEEVIEADVILHVRDISHAQSDAQGADVDAILRDLGIEEDASERIVEVWNKYDLLDENRRTEALSLARRRSAGREPYVISALTGEGIDALLAGLELKLSRGHSELSLTVDAADGAGLAWLYGQCEVLERRSTRAGNTKLLIRVAPERLARVMERFPKARPSSEAPAKKAAE
jgi:GTP-binding protein HflX